MGNTVLKPKAVIVQPCDAPMFTTPTANEALSAGLSGKK
jgi:hypothetical protein